MHCQFTKGDTIAILATARKNIDDNLRPAIDLLHSWGLEVIIGNTIGLDNNQLAGTDAQRAADFQQQLTIPILKRFGVKGGYGTVRIIDLLDFTKFKQSPKWIVGLAISPFTQSFKYDGIKPSMVLCPSLIPNLRQLKV
jgi:muramoyltetrapeptide carboxypeptidase